MTGIIKGKNENRLSEDIYREQYPLFRYHLPGFLPIRQ